jgi:hypothetical protein
MLTAVHDGVEDGLQVFEMFGARGHAQGQAIGVIVANDGEEHHSFLSFPSVCAGLYTQ